LTIEIVDKKKRKVSYFMWHYTNHCFTSKR